MNKCTFPLIQQAQVWKLILQKQEALILKDMCSRTFITILFIGSKAETTRSCEKELKALGREFGGTGLH